MLLDIEFFRKNSGRAAGSSGPFKPSGGGDGVPRTRTGQRHPEIADQKCSFGSAQSLSRMTVTVEEAPVAEVGENRRPGRPAAWIVRRQCAPDFGQEERGVDTFVVGGPLPAAGGVKADPIRFAE